MLGILDTFFWPFATDLAIMVTPATLPFFQMWSNVICKNMPYLKWLTRAFSLVKKDLLLAKPEILSYDTPLWHSTFFRIS